MVDRRDKGVILIIVLWLLAALSLLALGLAYRLSLEGRIMRNRRDRTEMLELGRAAVALAQARIERSETGVTFHGQPWARPILLSDMDFAELGADALRRCRVEAIVFDELGKLNINSCTRGQLLAVPGVDEAISAAIIDWRDADDTPLPLGAEDRFYGRLEPAYSCKNGPFYSITELLLLRGMESALFAGPSQGAMMDADDPHREYRPAGLADFLTTKGEGRININTASPEILMAAVPGFDELMIENLIAFRRGMDGIARTEDDVAVESFEMLEEIGGMTEFAINQARMHCVLSSDVFHIRVVVTAPDATARLELNVDVVRSESGLEITCWRET